MQVILFYTEYVSERFSRVKLMEIGSSPEDIQFVNFGQEKSNGPNEPKKKKYIQIINEEGNGLDKGKILTTLDELPLKMNLSYKHSTRENELPIPATAWIIKTFKNSHHGLVLRFVPAKEFREHFRLSFIQSDQPVGAEPPFFSFYEWDSSGLCLKSGQHDIFIHLPTSS